MSRRSNKILDRLPKRAFILLGALMLVVWVAGGASRADVLGQVVVRAAAWLILIVAVLFASRPDWRPTAPVTILLFASIGMVILQLIPLPPSLWTQFPGREVLAQTASVIDQPQPWRPISISPGATINALSSLIVPLVVLILLTYFTDRDHKRLLALMLGFVVASSLVGVLQFSGSSFDNPFVNDVAGNVNGTFANRNHFGLFLAFGCVLAPAWAFSHKHVSRWKLLAAIGLVTVFVLLILATGSRAGMLVGLVGVILGFLSVSSHIKEVIKTLPRRVWLPVASSAISFVVIAVIASLLLDRAVSVDRAFMLDASHDLRTAGWPTVWQATLNHFPVGTGFGTFDPLFRIYEPDYLLGPSYWNHAHNDWIEIVLDGGLLALAILSVAWVWWTRESRLVWFSPSGEQATRGRVGSSIILLIGLASIVDYPARTPIIMSVLIIAGVWLATNGVSARRQRASLSRSKVT